MKDPEWEGGDADDLEGDGAECLPEWITLPTLLQNYLDKHFAAYQLNVHEANQWLQSGSIKEAKYNKIIADCVKPLLLMHGSGAPATAKYTKDHLVLKDGQMTLKDTSLTQRTSSFPRLPDGSKSTLILFDLKELRIKLGALKWTELRVLKAKTGLGQVTLEIDLEFLKQAGKGSQLPGMDEYESPADPSEHEEVPDADTAADFAAMGLTEPHGVPDLELDPESTGSLVVPSLEEALENLLDEDPDSESQEEEISVAVFLDSEGNLVCSSEDVEKVPPDTSATMIEAEGAKGAYTKSEAWIFLNAKGLALVPPLQGCGLCYNRTDAGMCATVSKSFQIEDTG
eukprot:Skav228513  [mRNA]  locus=scaffold3621:47:1360:+ [translate_table: standard]